jgi:hypothetical protein
MEAPQNVYNQSWQLFRSKLLFPGSRLTSLDTKRPNMGTMLNMGAFSDRRWNASVKKVLAGQYAVLGLKAETPDFPNQKIWFGAIFNPPGEHEAQIRAKLPDVHVESLAHGGLLVLATDGPLPDDTEINRRRFLHVHDALQPTFLSREQTPENKRGMLGYFYRERSSGMT